MTMYNFNNTSFERIKTSKDSQQAKNIFLYAKPNKKQQQQQEVEQQRKVIVAEAQTFGAGKVHCCRIQDITKGVTVIETVYEMPFTPENLDILYSQCVGVNGNRLPGPQNSDIYHPELVVKDEAQGGTPIAG